MYISLKKILVVFGLCAGTCYWIYTATDQEYVKAIASYNKSFNAAFTLWQTPPAARPLNWEDGFIDAVITARQLFTTINLYWEHDKRTLQGRNRAARQIMNITAIPGQPKTTDAPILLAQHEKILAQLEAEAQKLVGSRSALRRAVNDLKLLFQTTVQDISTRLGRAQRNLTAAETAITSLAGNANYQQAKQSFDEAIKLLDCLDNCTFDPDPASCLKQCRAKHGL